jgi:hypothetical protein
MTRVLADYRWVVGLLFVIASTWLVVTALIWLGKWFYRRWQIFRAQHQVKKDIPSMTTKEREIIGYLLANNQKDFTYTADGGYANTLISKRIVVCALLPGQSYTDFGVTFKVPEHVWDVLAEQKAEFPYTPPKPGKTEPYPWAIPWKVR